MLLPTKDFIKIFGTCDMNASVFSLWSETEAGYEWWKCDLQFPTSLCLNWLLFFFWEREKNERCCTGSHQTEQLSSIIAGWWHWPHHTKGKIRFLPWVPTSWEPSPWSRAGIRRFPAEDFWGLWVLSSNPYNIWIIGLMPVISRKHPQQAQNCD